jgi:hypothetical protein
VKRIAVPLVLAMVVSLVTMSPMVASSADFSGKIVDGATGTPFQLGQVFLWVYRFVSAADGLAYPVGFRLFVTTSSFGCPFGEVCPDANGDFHFDTLTPGSYQLETWAFDERHLNSRTNFNLGASSVDLGTIVLDPKPILIEIVDVSPRELPSEGGALTLKYKVCKNPASDLRAVDYVARAFVSGIPAGGFSIEDESRNSRRGSSSTTRAFKDTFRIGPGAEDGNYICVSVQASADSDTFEYLDDHAACVPKGFLSSAPPLFEARCSLPSP